MDQPPSTFTIQDILEGKVEEEWRRKGIPEKDIQFSRLTGMDAGDIRGFQKFTARQPGYLIIVRCPKVTARPHHGVFPPKPGWASGSNSGDSGLVLASRKLSRADGSETTKSKWAVSDYDLMSVWRRGPHGFEKVVVTSGENKGGAWVAKDGAKTGPFSPQTTILIRELNGCMESRSRIMHGCQDDWVSTDNRGVRAGDRFAAFNCGGADYFDGPATLEHYYQKFHLAWPYDISGKYNSTKTA